MRLTVVVAIVVLVIAVLAVANTASGRRWLEDRADTTRWFINEVKTLTPR
jgi:hypothetical protein